MNSRMKRIIASVVISVGVATTAVAEVPTVEISEAWSRASIGTPTPTVYAKYAVARIGYDTMVSPYWVHEIFMWLQARAPDELVGYMILVTHKGIRLRLPSPQLNLSPLLPLLHRR